MSFVVTVPEAVAAAAGDLAAIGSTLREATAAAFDGILVPPHPVTATISFPGAPVPIPGFPTTVTVFGTPFMGMAPLLINYIPQQLALAIKPAA